MLLHGGDASGGSDLSWEKCSVLHCDRLAQMWLSLLLLVSCWPREGLDGSKVKSKLLLKNSVRLPGPMGPMGAMGRRRRAIDVCVCCVCVRCVHCLRI